MRPGGSPPVVLITPSRAAAVELPRRLATVAGAQTNLYPFKLLDLARAVAEPHLLGRGLLPWDSGHPALLAARLLEGPHTLQVDARLPVAPVARALGRTLTELRSHGVEPRALKAVCSTASHAEDERRLQALAGLYQGFHDLVDGHFADPAALLRAACEFLPAATWLEGAEVLIAPGLEADPLERGFLAALVARHRVKLLASVHPPGLWGAGFDAWATSAGIAAASWNQSRLSSLEPPTPPAGLERLREHLFEAPTGAAVRDGSVELLTAAGEAAEVQSVVRRVLTAAAHGVALEDIGVVLPRPDTYAPLFTDVLERLGVPYRLHPSLPLRFGRAARSLLLLFRCRGLSRAAVLEFLTFAPIPFGEFFGEDVVARPARWDQISRDAKIVSGLERWMIGLRAHAEAEREGADRDADNQTRRAARLGRAADAEALLRVVELLAATLDNLSGEASWSDWSERLRSVLDQWIGPESDREAVAALIDDLASLGLAGNRAPWDHVESVIEARCEWERLPVTPASGGALHVGALDAIAGLPFRLLAIVGLVEGGYPGVLRPDPFLLDDERQALHTEPGAAPRADAGARHAARQLSLFEPEQETEPSGGAAPRPPTTQERVLEERRRFHRAVSQATERLILSYPRADPRSGRERMPSLFFVAAAAALEGRPLGAQELDALVVEDALDGLDLQRALDRSERDRLRVRSGAAQAVAAGSSFFKQSLLASRARWSDRLTPYDGLIAPLAPELASQLDPVTAAAPISASRLAVYSRCGFQYLLQHVLRLEPALEPEERKRLEPLERGSLFHDVAERFLRERRQRGELPVEDSPAQRERLLEIAAAALDTLVEGSPPRFTLLWERERARFRETMLKWLEREATQTRRATPAYFEVAFGLSHDLAEGEPHSPEPLEIDLGEGRTLRVRGKIDRIDRRDDGTLVLRDYKTGRAPRDEGGLFRGGKQLQIPFYVLAAARLFPEQPVVEAFLDYVDGGRRVALDPALVGSTAFTELLQALTAAIGQGLFVQEPAVCDFCDYGAVCGPRPLLQVRMAYKIGDPRVQRVLRLRNMGQPTAGGS